MLKDGAFALLGVPPRWVGPLVGVSLSSTNSTCVGVRSDDGHFVHVVDPEQFATPLQAFVEHCDQAG